MVLMNLFIGQELRHRLREWTCGHREVRGGWDKFGDGDWHVYATMCRIESLQEASV